MNVRQVCAEAVVTLATVAAIPCALLLDRLRGSWRRRGPPDWLHSPHFNGVPWVSPLLTVCLGALVLVVVVRVLNSEERRYAILAGTLGAAALLAAPLAFTFGFFLMEVLELGLAAYNPFMMLTAALLLVAGACRLVRRQRDRAPMGAPEKRGNAE